MSENDDRDDFSWFVKLFERTNMIKAMGCWSTEEQNKSLEFIIESKS